MIYLLDTKDIPELDEHFWENAKMVKPITKKSRISIIGFCRMSKKRNDNRNLLFFIY